MQRSIGPTAGSGVFDVPFLRDIRSRRAERLALLHCSEHGVPAPLAARVAVDRRDHPSPRVHLHLRRSNAVHAVNRG